MAFVLSFYMFCRFPICNAVFIIFAFLYIVNILCVYIYIYMYIYIYKYIYIYIYVLDICFIPFMKFLCVWIFLDVFQDMLYIFWCAFAIYLYLYLFKNILEFFVYL